MSIRRPKRASRKNEPDAAGPGGSQTAKIPEWAAAVGEKPDEKFSPYASATTFAEAALVRHAKFGKGIVVAVDGNKIDILFEQGVKKLLHSTPG